MNLRQITIKDQLELKKIYFDSIQSLDEKIYSKEQKRAWSSQAWDNPNFDKSIIKGKGWLISEKGIIYNSLEKVLKNIGCNVTQDMKESWYGQEKKKVLNIFYISKI